MGTIIERWRKDGTTSWLAQIAVRRAGKTVWCDSHNFQLRSTGAASIEEREKDLAKPGALENLPMRETRRREVTFGATLVKHVEDSAKAIGRTKAQVLKIIKVFDTANKLCAKLGCTERGIMAITSHRTSKAVTRYTRAARQMTRAESVVHRLSGEKGHYKRTHHFPTSPP